MSRKKIAISFLLVFTLVFSCLAFSKDLSPLTRVFSSFASLYAPNGTVAGNKASMCFGEDQMSISNHFNKTKITYYK